jgi:ParB-like chromosome segregation protein Spo0J
VRDGITGADATAISLVENVHRADMNPKDDNLSDVQAHYEYLAEHDAIREKLDTLEK